MLLSKVFSKQRQNAPVEWSITVPIVFSLIYWYITAPDIRFAHAMLFLLANTMCILFVTDLDIKRNSRTWFALIGLVFVLCNLSIGISMFQTRAELMTISAAGWRSLPQEPWTYEETSPGLQVVVPDDLLCWDAPLPCTPLERYDPSLTLINPEDMGAGFMIPSNTN